jgi:alkylation response protein AidB-like acyl-CoA dehydrogenase
MDFELAEHQQALRAAARRLLDVHAAPTRVRELVASGEPYDRKLWDAIVAQGWLSVEVAEAAGGLGLGFVEVAVLAEEVGRHNAPVPFVPTVLARSALAATPWAVPLADGSAIGAVGWAPAETSRVLVAYAPVADVAVVAVGDDRYAVDLSSGVGRPAAEPAMDLTRCVGWIDLDRGETQRLDRPGTPASGRQRPGPTPAGPQGEWDGVPAGPQGEGDPVPAGRVGPGGDGPDEAARLLDRGAAAGSAEMLGGAARVLDMTTDYARQRVQFGQPIGAFQAVKHRCADMLVDVEGMRSTAYYAAWCISVDDPDRSVAASTAKIWCSDAARRVMASGLQVHGGIGFTWDHDLHLYLKRSQLDQVSFGDAATHRERLARLLRARLDAGASVLQPEIATGTDERPSAP